PDLPPKPTIKKALRSNNPQGLEVTDNDPVEVMRKQLKNLQINLTKMKKATKKNSNKPKSSNRKTKTKSRTKKSSRSKRVNAHIISDKSSSDSSDSENSTISSENELETNTLARSWNESESDFSRTSDKRSKKHKSARSKTSTKKSSNASNKKNNKVRPEGSLLHNTRSLKIPTDNISLNAFFAILRSMVNSFTHTQPKEVSINSYNMINAEFIALKDPVLNHFTSNFSDKEQEKFWHEITIIFSHILQPISDLIRIASQQTNIPPKTAPEEIQSEAEISWPNPIEINFIRKIIPND
ncbi:13671_t:CDS:2, partial [Cetraspora pellucida]